MDKKTINLDLGNCDLLLDTSANPSSSPALMVIDGGKVKLTGTGTGEFHVKGRSTAVSAVGVGVEVTVHMVETEDGSGVNMYGSGDLLESNSTVTVLGSAIAGKNSIAVGNGTGVNMNAKGGKVFVTGNIASGRDGVYIASNPGTQVTVNGNITVTSGSSTVNLVGIRAYGATTAVTVTGDVTVLGANCLGIHASASTIKVDGNVASTGMGVQSDANGKVEITGSLSAGFPFITVGATEMNANEGTGTDGGALLYTDGPNTVQIGSVGVLAPVYTTTVQTHGNGTASASPSVASAGTKVTLTANPGSSYRFKEWQVVSGGVTITANKFTMPSGDVTVKAIFEPVDVATHLVTVNGSYAGTSGAGQYAPGIQVTIHAGSRSNYSFTGWTTSDGVTFANAGNATTTFNMPAKNVTVTAKWTYSGGGGNGSSDNDNNPSIPPPVASEWLERSGTSAPIAEAKEKSHGHALTRANGQYGVRAAAWAALTGYQYWHDTMDGSAVQVRVYVKNPTAITTDLLVSGYVKGAEAQATKSLFEKYFSNKVLTIHLDQTGAWGQSVEVAAKVDLTGMDVTRLMLYSYDKATNTYRRIEKPAYWVDINGYLHFNTPYAGDIVISEGPLTLIENGGAK